MEIYIEEPPSWSKKISAILIVIGILSISGIAGLLFRRTIDQPVNLSSVLSQSKELAIIQNNSLLAVSNPVSPPQPVQKIKMVITAYSSTPWETDNDPFITASGKFVRDGIVANNLLPFGTQIRIPEIYGDKVFVVEDRMNWRKGYYHLDIWFPEHRQAKYFGVKNTYVEILEN